MLHWLRNFKPTKQGLLDNWFSTAVWSGLTLVVSWLFTSVATGLVLPSSDREWVFLFLKVFLSLSAAFLVIALGRFFWLRAGGHPLVVKEDRDTVQSDEPLPTISFAIEGDWLNTPFQCGKLDARPNGQPAFSEDIYLVLTANTFLENVRIEIIAATSACNFPLSNQVHLAGTKGQRMSSSGRLTCNPRQYHAAHPHQCFVCRCPFSSGIRHTHEDTGAKTCSSMCITLYERWWLRKRQEVQAVASTPNDAEAR
jgi:hypothetical protein